MSRSQYVAVHCVYMVAWAPTNKTKSINIADMLADMLQVSVVAVFTACHKASEQKQNAEASATSTIGS